MQFDYIIWIASQSNELTSEVLNNVIKTLAQKHNYPLFNHGMFFPETRFRIFIQQ